MKSASQRMFVEVHLFLEQQMPTSLFKKKNQFKKMNKRAV